MARFNLSTRIELFAICTSIEVDIKEFILHGDGKIAFTSDMRSKAKERKKDLDVSSDQEVLDQLDLKDYVEIICSSPYQFSINNEKARILERYFEKIIPVRNRVMHTKPLELGDRALLIEVLEKISVDLKWIEWKEVLDTKQKIETNPSELLAQHYRPRREYNPKVYNNLPEPEFDDTGYIGRVREQKEIKDLILNNKNQIITIVGNGGVGKTAIVVKTLYDLVDDPNCPFECIIWLTLKTKTLSNGEFVQIEDCIRSIPDIYKFSQDVIITDEEKPSKEMLLQFMDDFKVLLVLDNLETINADDINEFMKEIPEKSKVLITSRHGLGELEIRKKLGGLEKQDTIVYFRELSRYYGLDLHKRSDDEIYKITGELLYSNPLSIKWFISGVFNGMSEKKLLSQKDDLINFCISNVFEKLSDDSKKILQVFLLEKKKLSYGVIDYYMDIDEVSLRESINELLSTYMINSVSGEYIMNEMSREYISINYPPNNSFITHIFRKRKELKQIMQAVKISSEHAPFNPCSISVKLEDDNKQLATFYLQEALRVSREKKWEEANKFCEKAQNIEPNFYEVYKIKGFMDAERGEYYGAISNYEIALLKCKNEKEKAIVCYLFSVFYTVKMQELDYGLDYIEKADELLPNTSEILLEKARVYMYLGRYEEAEVLLNRVNAMEVDPVLRTQNIMASRYAELYRRKAELLEKRDYEKKLELYNIAIQHLNAVKTLDIKSGITLVYVLSDLAYLYHSKDAMNLLVDTISRNFRLLSSINHRKKGRMCDFLRLHKEDISPEIYAKMERFITDYSFYSKEITNCNEGVVTAVKEYYGFISNHEYKNTNAIFFLKENAYKGIQVGDFVSFDMYEGKKGKAAKNLTLLKDESVLEEY